VLAPSLNSYDILPDYSFQSGLSRYYIADGHQAALTYFVNAWYDAGCPNVWFEMSRRDINGRSTAYGLIVELPENKAQRAKCYEILKQHDPNLGPAELQDNGDTYLATGLR
jgi:hypothetical protein